MTEKDKTYARLSLPTNLLYARGEPGGGEITITGDSVDTGERRQIGSYKAQHMKTTITIDPSKDSRARNGKVEVDGWYIDLPGWNYCDDSVPVEVSNPDIQVEMEPGSDTQTSDMTHRSQGFIQ